jgi:hypothetical protein
MNRNFSPESKTLAADNSIFLVAVNESGAFPSNTSLKFPS